MKLGAILLHKTISINKKFFSRRTKGNGLGGSMNREEENREDKHFGMVIFNAFQMLLSEDEYTMSHTTAQDLYNKICAVLRLVPTAIKIGFSKKAGAIVENFESSN